MQRVVSQGNHILSLDDANVFTNLHVRAVNGVVAGSSLIAPFTWPSYAVTPFAGLSQRLHFSKSRLIHFQTMFGSAQLPVEYYQPLQILDFYLGSKYLS
jgi:hypothetical protein